MKVKILHLYYDIMNLYGEYRNLKILEKHLKDQGLDVEIEKKTISDNANLDDYDFIYMGAGTEKNQIFILEDMKTKYKQSMKKAIDDGKIILLTGNSYEVLGKSINGKEALEIFDFETKIGENRITSDIIAKSDILDNKVIGFVNNMSQINGNNIPLFEIEFGATENKESSKEGIIYNNLIGTHLIGPILTKNPEILKMFVEKICNQKDENFNYKEINYEYEEKAYKIALEQLELRKQK